MTEQEKRTIAALNDTVAKLREENGLYRDLLTKKVDELESQVHKKHLPIMFEDQIMEAVDKSLAKALTEAMTGYNSPLVKYAHNVVNKYQSEIEAVFDSVVKEAISTEDFRQRVREVLIGKIAKTMISGVDGSIDKTVNLMKQDAVFRSRLTLSVNGLVDEFLKIQKSGN